MSLHIDCGISPEATCSADVLVRTYEPGTLRPNHSAKRIKPSPLKEVDTIQARSALRSAIDCLRDELISLYVAAEQVHWHLRMKSDEMQSRSAFFDLAEVARQYTGSILCAIVRCVRIRETLLDGGETDALLKAVLALQAENDALAPSAAF